MIENNFNSYGFLVDVPDDFVFFFHGIVKYLLN